MSLPDLEVPVDRRSDLMHGDETDWERGDHLSGEFFTGLYLFCEGGDCVVGEEQ